MKLNFHNHFYPGYWLPAEAQWRSRCRDCCPKRSGSWIALFGLFRYSGEDPASGITGLLLYNKILRFLSFNSA